MEDETQKLPLKTGYDRREDVCQRRNDCGVNEAKIKQKKRVQLCNLPVSRTGRLVQSVPHTPTQCGSRPAAWTVKFDVVTY